MSRALVTCPLPRGVTLGPRGRVQVLVQKEWVSFGHKFAQRGGFDDHGFASHERSPIFQQWLDVVYQILRQVQITLNPMIRLAYQHQKVT
jgi:hypothetical protein